MSDKKVLNAVQQEIQEREKHLVEMEQGINQLRSQQQQLNSQGQMLEKEKKRCYITKQELSTLTNDHNVYRAIGRAFVRQPVETLMKEENQREAYCTTEIQTVEGRKKQLAETLKSQQLSMESQYKEYLELAQSFQGKG